jgi:hypothetical protein
MNRKETQIAILDSIDMAAPAVVSAHWSSIVSVTHERSTSDATCWPDAPR